MEHARPYAMARALLHRNMPGQTLILVAILVATSYTESASRKRTSEGKKGRAMTEAEKRVLQAAREWITERDPADYEERALFVAVARAYPEDCGGRETCKCGEADTCDECLSADEIEGMVARLELSLGKPAAKT